MACSRCVQAEQEEIALLPMNDATGVTIPVADISKVNLLRVDPLSVARKIRLQLAGDQSQESNVIFPLPEVGDVECTFGYSDTMSAILRAKFPNLVDAVGSCTKGVSATIVFLDSADADLSGSFRLPGGKTLYMDAIDGAEGKSDYFLYDRHDGVNNREETIDNLDDVVHIAQNGVRGRRKLDLDCAEPTTTRLIKFKLAMTANVQYSNYWINKNPGTETPKAEVMKQLVVLLNRVNGIFRNEFGIYFEYFDDQDKIICATTADDSNDLPTGCSGLADNSAILNQNFDFIDSNTNADYDLGHALVNTGGGRARLRSLCDPDDKADGMTGLSTPENDPFFVDYVSHEIGHQLNGDHAFRDCSSQSDNFDGDGAVEPGSGTTIMGYAGICNGDDVQDNADAYFGGLNLVVMKEYIYNTAWCQTGCGTIVDTGLARPEVDVFDGTCSIPVTSTGFALTGTRTGGPGTADWGYSWDRVDTSTSNASEDYADLSEGRFRSWDPIDSTTRVMPNFHKLRYGATAVVNDNKWELMGTQTKTMTFRFIARTQHQADVTNSDPGANTNTVGDFDYKDMDVSLVDNAPLLITTDFSAGACPNEVSTIQWNVGGTVALSSNVVIEMAKNTLTPGSFDRKTDLVPLEWTSLGTFPNSGSANVNIQSVGAAEGEEVFIRVRSTDDECFFFDFAHFNLLGGTDCAPPEPSSNPSAAPSSKPSSIPSMVPSSSPSTGEPSTSPSMVPSSSPSTTPPSSKPSVAPSNVPSSSPTTSEPSVSPSMVPSSLPSIGPSMVPSTSPSDLPSQSPSTSSVPSSTPSAQPSSACADSTDWSYPLKGDKTCDCECISNKKSKSAKKVCEKKESDDGIPAFEACPLTCGICVPDPTEFPSVGPTNVPSMSPSSSPTKSGQPTLTCSNSDEWHFIKDNEKCGCDCVATKKDKSRKKICDKKKGVGIDDRTADEACPVACDTCPFGSDEAAPGDEGSKKSKKRNLLRNKNGPKAVKGSINKH